MLNTLPYFPGPPLTSPGPLLQVTLNSLNSDLFSRASIVATATELTITVNGSDQFGFQNRDNSNSLRHEWFLKSNILEGKNEQASIDFPGNGTGNIFINDFNFGGVAVFPLLVAATVPEPMTLTLFGIGIMGLGALNRRRRREV